MFSSDQKKLVLDILLSERNRLFSNHKGKLLDKTISDLLQMIRNEKNIPDNRIDKSLDWSTRDKRK